MSLEVTFTEDPSRVLDEAGAFLRVDPVRNFTMLALLNERATKPEPGRYWVAKREDEVEGVVFQSSLDFPTALITRMEPDAIDAVVEAIAGAGFSLPGIGGSTETATAFAGRWGGAVKVGVVPLGGQRIYEATELSVGAPLAAPRLAKGQSSSLNAESSSTQKIPSPQEGEGQGEGSHTLSPLMGERWREGEGLPAGQASTGHLRQATPADRDLLIEWMRGFHANHPHADPVRMVDTRLPAAHFWIWDDDGPVSAACQSEPLEGAVSIQAVYTPPELRNRGYATACVATLTVHILANHHRPMLYTNLANPTSNSIYRRIRYDVEDVFIRYRFEH